MSNNAAVVQIHQRETFERNMTRALVAGAAAGGVGFLARRLLGLDVPLAFLSIAATALACVRGDKFDRLILGALAVVAPALPWLFGMSQAWTVGSAGAIAGLLMVKARLTEKGEEGSVGADRPGLVHYATTAAATGGLAVAGLAVAEVLNARMIDFAAPVLLRSLASGTVIALFAGIGSLAAHIALKSDPVEARGEEVLSLVRGQFQELTSRGLRLYRECGVSLAALPRDPAREELARTVQQLTKDAFDLAAEWSGVESTMHDATERELMKEVTDLTKSAAAAKDPVAKRQLEMAAQSLTEELVKLGELKLKRERVVAKLKSQLALLERARVALIGMRSSHASIRGAEMSAVARKLNALATSQADEAQLAHEVATNAELRALDQQVADVQARATLATAEVQPRPSAPVAAPEAPAAVDPGATATTETPTVAAAVSDLTKN